MPGDGSGVDACSGSPQRPVGLHVHGIQHFGSGGHCRIGKTAAPSLIPDALPAVTVPSFLNAGFILPSVSIVVPGFTCSSVSNLTSPFFVCSTMGTICELKRPSAIAGAARR